MSAVDNEFLFLLPAKCLLWLRPYGLNR